MGNGNIGVGSETPTRESGQPIVERLVSSGGFTDLRLDDQDPLKRGGSQKMRRDVGAERR